MTELEDRIAAAYSGLSGGLKKAADHVLHHPVDIATRSLRAVAMDSGLSPATFSRLARALGFGSYEELREMQRGKVGTQFSEKARALQRDHAAPQAFLADHVAAVSANIRAVEQSVGSARLHQIVSVLVGARQVLVAGALSSSGLAQHFVYLAGFLTPDWHQIEEGGAAALANAGSDDVLIVVSLQPFAERSMRLAEVAQARGLTVVVITDSLQCPALARSDLHVLVPTDSPQFFSSNAAVLVVMEALIGLMVTQIGETAQERIAAVAELNHLLKQYQPGS